jgi:hypothetical protein
MTFNFARFILATATIAVMAAAPVRAEGLADRNTQEAALLRAYPDVATRDARGLTVFRDGHPVARFHNVDETHCQGNDTCSLWWFDGVLRLGTGSDRRTYAEVFHSNGEGWEVMLIGDDRDPLVFENPLVPSPDGRYAATGVTSGLEDAYLSIIDWTSPGHRLTATFGRLTGCEPLNWEGPDAFRAICDHEKSKTHYSLATVQRAGDGTWQLTEIGIIDWQTRQLVADPDFVPRSDTAHATVPPAQSAERTAGDDAYFKRDGFEKLN